MNSTICANLIAEVDWRNPRLLTALGFLALIDVMVILGNILVISAVCLSSKLRSVTNFLVVSLALADLMVGVAVLPFSATWEVFKVKYFSFHIFKVHVKL